MIKKSRLLKIISICLVVIVALTILYYVSNKQENIKIAEKTLEEMCESTYENDTGAFATCVMIHSIWYDTIYSEYEADTILYTLNQNSRINEDFNTSLSSYFSSEVYKKNSDSIEEKKQELKDTYLKLSKMPDYIIEYRDAAKEIYKTYSALAESALSPQGNINEFSTSYNDSKSSLSSAVEDAKLIIEK